MKERPILFKGAMVLAILDGRKTQTRRVVTADVAEALDFLGGHADGEPATGEDIDIRWGQADDDDGKIGKAQWLASCAEYPDEGVIEIGAGYGQPGDKLWVREAWRTIGDDGRCNDVPPRDLQPSPVWYEADGKAAISELVGKYRPPMFMPRWASRITLEITNVRVERLQEISNDDALAEGINRPIDARYPVDEFRALWDSINATRGFGWDVNSWVWVVEFRRIS